jgi:DHA1 family bicyclomycin/chloramphenicol resistance-like MFS transporter
MVFLTPPLFAVIVFVWSVRLEESLPAGERLPVDWMSVWQSVRKVLSNRTFLRYMSVTTILFTALSSYISSSEHIVGEIYGRPELFAWIFGGMGLLMSCFTLINSRLTLKFGARVIVRWLLCIYTLIGAVVLLYTLVYGDPPPMVVFFAGVSLMLAINLAVEPNSSALALEPMGSMAGMASSVYGTVFFFIGATFGAVISGLMHHGVLPLVLSFFVLGVVTLGLVFSDGHRGTS